MTTFYLDTSVARLVLQGEEGSGLWFDEMLDDLDADVISSRLLQTELIRTLRRDHHELRDHEIVTGNVEMHPITESIHAQAEAIGPHVKSLDAIHLATALSSGIPDIVMVSHDATMLEVARELGLRTFDPAA